MHFIHYLKIIRSDRWFKNFFVILGAVIVASIFHISLITNIRLLLSGTIAVCFLSSANYCLNEWFDAKYDKFHPIKRKRTAVVEQLDVRVVYIEYGLLLGVALIISIFLSPFFFVSALLFIATGIFYNIPPFRAKDVVHIDILADAFTSPLRILMGWLILRPESMPPISLMFGFWMAASYFMGIKRFAELRCFGHSENIEIYRYSFKFYTEKNLLCTAICYGILSVLCLSLFVFQYTASLIITLPLYAALLIWYYIIGRKPESLVQHPEHLYREKGFFYFCVLFYCFIGWLLIF